ncbi:hypothetical protein PYCC9005_001303 [Savitreella phatthalungensis]
MPAVPVERVELKEPVLEATPAAESIRAPSVRVGYPEGGYGWVVVAASASIYFCGWGLSNAWGTFQTYFQDTLYPNEPDAAIALIGSLQAALIEGTGVIVGLFIDRVGVRPVMIGGAVLQLGGLLAASFAKTVWQLYLSQAVMFGIGAGTLYIVAVSVPGQWFDKRKATAYGLLYTSSGAGGIVWPIVLTLLLDNIGFGWTVRIVLLVSAIQIVFGVVFMRTRSIEPIEVEEPAKVDLRAIYSDKKLWFISAFYLVLSIGMLNPMFYLSGFGPTVGVGRTLSFYLLAVLNASSIPGRTICGLAADRCGRLNVLIISTTAAAIVCLAVWTTVTGTGGVIALAVLYGFAFGGLISLMPAVTAQICGQHHLATKFGLVSAAGAIGCLVGAPLAALFLNGRRSGYQHCAAFSGAFIVLAAFMMIGLRWKLERRLFKYV